MLQQGPWAQRHRDDWKQRPQKWPVSTFTCLWNPRTDRWCLVQHQKQSVHFRGAHKLLRWIVPKPQSALENHMAGIQPKSFLFAYKTCCRNGRVQGKFFFLPGVVFNECHACWWWKKWMEGKVKEGKKQEVKLRGGTKKTCFVVLFIYSSVILRMTFVALLRI